MSSFRFLEVLYTLVRDKIKSQEDCIIVALHCFLINKGNKCVGTGENWPENENVNSTELLPDFWNSIQDVYTFRYVSNSTDTKYLLKVLKTGDLMLVNVLNITEDKAAALTLKTPDCIGKDFKKFPGTFLNLAQLEEKLQQEIVQQVRGKSNKNKTEETVDPKQEEDITSDTSIPCRPSANLLEGYGYPSLETNPQRVPFPQVGQRDLDPLASGPGGMLFDPRNLGRPQRPPTAPFGLPPGAIPPGARFDPFGPSMFNRGGPDPDELPPPDYDNSFI